MKRTHIPEKIKEKVRQTAKHRCGYCLFLQKYLPNMLRIDHISPLAKGGTNDEENLWLLCETCNRAKSDKTEGFDVETETTVSLFNPRRQNWDEHFEWSDNFTLIIGKTPTGRVTVAELNLNKERLVAVRREWVSAGWHPPKARPNPKQSFVRYRQSLKQNQPNTRNKQALKASVHERLKRTLSPPITQ